MHYGQTNDTKERLRRVRPRLGWLSLANALDPDRRYCLDLAVRDEREVAKVLVALAVAEPGENWVDERYKRESGAGTGEWIAGWELPKEWEHERAGDEATGVRRVGDLELTYKGAKPDWSARRELTRRFLCGAPRAF